MDSTKHNELISLAGKNVVTELVKIETDPIDMKNSGLKNFKSFAYCFVIFGAMIMWLVNGGFHEILTKHFILIPMTVVAILLISLATALFFITKKENNLLKVTDVGKGGISLGRYGSTTLYSGGYKVDWNKLKYIDLVGTKSDKYLLIEIQGGIVFKIKWKNAFDWVEESQLLDAVKTYAPNAIVNLPRVKKLTDKNDPRFTQLWLEYFSSPETRKKKGALVSGNTLDNEAYIIEKALAQGGQGRVYLATRSADGEKVVLKEYILPICQGTSIEQSEASTLEHEVKILSSINHPQIVKVFDCLIEDHRGYVVLEFVNGQSLRRLIKQNGPAKTVDVINWTNQILDILHYLHSMTPALVHRDLTPDNLMLGETGKLKLIDFTIAQHSKSSRLNTVAGKHSYMPPEQIKGEVNPANDYYALGCTIVFLLTGEDPLPLDPQLPSDLANKLPVELSVVIEELTRLEKNNRLTSAHNIKERLKSLTL